MKICMLIKYPPIQGGVSGQSYWLAHGLAKRGHEVHVVTNANEVEETYRLFMREEDQGQMEKSYPETGGFVRLYTSEPMTRRLSHIPRNNPVVSKLAGIASDVVEREHCDLIFAFYFEPYAVAGQLAAAWTGRPLVVQHAGSDLDRLMLQPDLAVTYRHVLQTADRIVTRTHLVPRYLSMGIPLSKLSLNMVNARGDVFRVDAKPLDLNGLIQELKEAGQHLVNDRPLDPEVPIIGIYGKPGTYKGTYDVIQALGKLKRSGEKFQFVTLTSLNEEFTAAVEREDLSDVTWALPFVPNWQVPHFIRACTAVCFLERDFPVTIHGPGVPREILSCGTALVLSGEIYGKQFYRNHLVDGENFYLVPDPKEIDQLANVLSGILADPERAAEVGARGADMIAQHEVASRAPEGYEQMFQRVLKKEPEQTALTTFSARQLFGFTANAAGEDAQELMEQAVLALEGQEDVLSAAKEWLINQSFAGEKIRFGCEVDLAILDLYQQKGRRFERADLLEERFVSLEQVMTLAPVAHSFLRFMQVTAESGLVGADFLLLFREANHHVKVMAVHERVIRILQECTGQRTVREIMEQLDMTDSEQSQMMFTVLQTLRTSRIITFQSNTSAFC